MTLYPTNEPLRTMLHPCEDLLRNHDDLQDREPVNWKMEKFLDLTPCAVIEFTGEEIVLEKQIIHCEVDMFVRHLSPAFSYDAVGVEGVMHHHQDYWFIRGKFAEAMLDVCLNT